MNATERLVMNALLTRRGLDLDSINDIEAAGVAEDTKAIVAALPSGAGVDFVRLMETWTEEGMNLTATLLDMAISATLLKSLDPGEIMPFGGLEVTISSQDLRNIAENYHWERHEEAGSWRISLQKVSEMSSEAVDTQ